MLHAFGLGNALVDFIVDANDEFVARADLRKGVMTLIDERQFISLMNSVKGKKVTILPGGSAANAMIGMARLGLKTAYCGRVGDDFHAEEYEKKLSEAGVHPALAKLPGITGTCVSLVTPDKERTMATCLASSAKFEAEDLSFETLKTSRILHIEGYQLTTENQARAAMMAMRFAKEREIMISFDMADPFVVSNHKEQIQKIADEYADIIFLNEPEAQAFCGKRPADAIESIGRKDAFVGLKMGKAGSLVRQGDVVEKIPIHKVVAKDTTGAGDLFAAGFLAGVAQEKSLRECGLLASYLAGEIVSQYGAYLPEQDTKRLDVFIKKNQKN